MTAGRRTQGSDLIPIERIERAIYLVRGEKVMLDDDLAEIYGSSTKRLNEQVSRNADRFPEDFAFRLTPRESRILKSQFATSSWGGRRKQHRAFTEHGAVMLASVLKTPVAVQASIQVVRAFVRMRELMLTHRDLARKLTELEKTVGRHDREIRTVFAAIRQLIETPAPPKRRIGFQSDDESS